MKLAIQLAALCVVLIVAMAGQARADLILSPVSVIGNTLGQLPATSPSDFSPSNLINQAGLSATFNSGVTDFDTYLAGNPTPFVGAAKGNLPIPGELFASPRTDRRQDKFQILALSARGATVLRWSSVCVNSASGSRFSRAMWTRCS